ncbi:hypothetical protein ACIBG7_27370 [Nonomuraea sp. NPDC050328]|uniref:hypothetical protein n=1 Tax=Nonomuraea sp. NPDC050328 TaxID=3364361 RepID=UPI00379F1217
MRFEFLGEVPRRTFSGLAELRPSTSSLVIDPTSHPGLRGSACSLADQAEYWAGEARRASPGPFIVMGYCSAASLALTLAEKLDGTVLGVLLFDPLTVTPEFTASSVRDVLASAGVAAGDRGTGALTEIEATLTGHENSGLRFLPEEIRSELVEQYMRWLAFVHASSGVSAPTTLPFPLHLFWSDPAFVDGFSGGAAADSAQVIESNAVALLSHERVEEVFLSATHPGKSET